MSARSLLAGLAATAVVSSALGIVTLAPASADPASTPDANDIVGVGSDTIEDVLDVLADGTNGIPGYNAGKTAADPLLASFKTVGSAQITLRTGSTPINRPVGSGAGKALLYGSTNNPDVTFARSSSAISTTEKQAGLQAFAFALDSLRMAVSGSVASNAPAKLTGADIVGIYKGDITDWSQIDPSKSGVIKPYVPQSGSGTRSFFEAQLASLNGGTKVTYGSSVNDTMHENTDDVLKNDPNAIAPFSLAKQATLFPSTVHLEASLANGGWSADRAVYNVVRGTSLADPTIQAIFGQDGFICSTDARPLIEAAGFKQLATPAHGGVCGAATQDPVNNFQLNEQVATTTALSVKSAKANAASLVASVTGDTAPDGTVTFYDGADVLQAGVPLVSGQATYDATGLTAGSHAFRAVFTPASGSSFDPSEATKSGTVKTSSKVTESFPASVAKGQRAKGVVTVVLADVAKAATGKVKVLLGRKPLATATLSGGRATVKLPALAKGTNKLKAVYAGSATAVGSQKSFTITQK